MIVDKTNRVPLFKLHELRCFDAVARLGSFQAAADRLHRTHPSVFAAVRRLEEGLGLMLLDRTGYRVTLTQAGRAFQTRASAALQGMDDLGVLAEQLSRGVEPMLRVVLGDLCPVTRVLPILSAFFADHGHTKLHLDYEAVGGPAERLRQGTADLAFHRVDASGHDFETIAICDVELIPVCAPGFLPPTPGIEISPAWLRALTQCVIRDTARDSTPEDHFLIDGSHQCSVADHGMKKSLILHGLAWGHLPDFMIVEELEAGSLIKLQSRLMPGRTETLAALRRPDRAHGPVANALWDRLSATLV